VTARRVAALVIVTAAAGGCGSTKHATPPTTTTTATATTAAVAIAPEERSACNLLFARLRRVTIALQTSSDLIAHSLNKTQLSRRIAIEQVQLQRSAALMTGGPVPGALISADRSLVARDFGRAKAPAAAGDFQAATAAMTDRPAVRRILQASTTIERACTLH